MILLSVAAVSWGEHMREETHVLASSHPSWTRLPRFKGQASRAAQGSRELRREARRCRSVGDRTGDDHADEPFSYIRRHAHLCDCRISRQREDDPVETSSCARAAEQHLQHADTVILNKLDQLDATRANLVEQRVRAVNPKARLLRAVQADVEVKQLLKGGSAARRRVITNGAVTDSSVGYQSRSFKITLPVDSALVKGWLLRFQRSVIRLKGFVRVAGRTGLQEVQWVMGAFSVTPYAGPKRSQAKIVIIGRRVPWQRFLEGFERYLVRPNRQTKRSNQRRRRKP
jgi:hypothetical protein